MNLHTSISRSEGQPSAPGEKCPSPSYCLLDSISAGGLGWLPVSFLGGKPWRGGGDGSGGDGVVGRAIPGCRGAQAGGLRCSRLAQG